MFCFPTPYGCVAGSGPELIVRIKKDEIFVAHRRCSRQRRECRSERDIDPIRDARLKRELLSDEKELAEHRMPIDLACNGIGKFVAPAFVLVQNAMRVACYESVLQIACDVQRTSCAAPTRLRCLARSFLRAR